MLRRVVIRWLPVANGPVDRRPFYEAPGVPHIFRDYYT
jgi:hypothetical protein